MVCLLKAPVRRTRGGSCLSVALYPPCCHLQSPTNCARRERRHVQLQGLSWQRPSALQSHDTRNKRVYPPLPPPRFAEGLPSHSLLRTSGQVFLCGKPCASAPAARRAKSASPP